LTFTVERSMLCLVFILGLFQFINGQCILGNQNGCSTAVALGLTKQIAAQLNKMGYMFTPLNVTTITCNTPCVNELQESAANALSAAATSRRTKIVLNSAWRSAAQQYLLYIWYQRGMCGIQIAAVPGTSNHEGGRAIDTSDYTAWMSALQSHGWKWYGDADRVHFDYLAATDLAKQNLIAFQTIWNDHNPNNKIAVDGMYGPATANALHNSPCNGW